MADHAADFQAAFARTDFDLKDMFYCAESVLLPQYRGQGAGHAFFDHRESHARALGTKYCAFCAVQRPQSHPLRPKEYRPLDGFWRKRGYERLPGVIAKFDWKDIDMDLSTSKPLQFWIKTL
jgi:GNAT superfamily N-acetyltransferase